MAKIPGLRPRGTKWYLRVRVPMDAVENFGQREVWKSLDTGDYRKAKSRYLVERAELERRFAAARRRPPMLTDAEAKRWVVERFHMGDRAAVEYHFSRHGGVSKEAVTEAEFDLGKASGGADEQVMAHVQKEADDLLIQNGWPVRRHKDGLGLVTEEAAVDKSSAAYQALCTYVRRSWVERERRNLARLKGDDVTRSADPMFAGISAGSVPARPEIDNQAADVPTLATVLDKWRAERQPPPTTDHEWGTAVRRFTEIHGDLRVDLIKKAHVRYFKDALLKLPVKLSRDVRAKTVPQIIAATKGSEGPRLSAATVKKQLTAIKTLLSWCLANGYVESNVAAGVSVAVPRNQNAGRLPYSVDDMRTLLAGLGEHADCEPSRYWLPLLAAFTGARLGELGQLRVSDVRRRDGIDYVDINAVDEGKSLKNTSTGREVPLHPELLRLGFLDHVERRRASGGGPLFPDPNPRKKGKLTRTFSGWWRDHRRKRGVSDHRKVFHSFRHTFKEACRVAGVGEEVHDALTGHSGGGVGRTYGTVPLEVKAREIAKVNYPDLDLSSLFDPPIRMRNRGRSPRP